MKKDRFIFCKCCKKKILNPFSTRKYCGNCSNYILKLRNKISSLESKIRKLNKELYGLSSPKIQKLNDKELGIIKNILKNKENE